MTTRNRNNQNIDPLLCDAAPKLLDALTRIAAIPLWGERIADEQLKADLLHAGEYDSDEDEFTPGCDTESSYLHDAVTIARAVLDEAKVAPATTDDDAPKLLDALTTVLEMEYDRDPESRNFDDERLEYFASLIAQARGLA
jgi:hypothetical protein